MYSIDYPAKLKEGKAEKVVYNYIDMIHYIASTYYPGPGSMDQTEPKEIAIDTERMASFSMMTNYFKLFKFSSVLRIRVDIKGNFRLYNYYEKPDKWGETITWQNAPIDESNTPYDVTVSMSYINEYVIPYINKNHIQDLYFILFSYDRPLLIGAGKNLFILATKKEVD